jgi:prepilin-type N-terminal cleavage/methylation domain-containing protein
MNNFLMKLSMKKKTNNEKRIAKRNSGFTLIEVLIVIGIIAILAAVVLVAINPSRQFAQARNSQRVSNVNALINAIGQNISDNKGLFVCSAGTVPTTATILKSTGGYDIRTCLVPNYLPEIPADPAAGSITSPTNYDTGYTVSQDATTKRFTVAAPAAELAEIITVVR